MKARSSHGGRMLPASPTMEAGDTGLQGGSPLFRRARLRVTVRLRRGGRGGLCAGSADALRVVRLGKRRICESDQLLAATRFEVRSSSLLRQDPRALADRYLPAVGLPM